MAVVRVIGVRWSRSVLGNGTVGRGEHGTIGRREPVAYAYSERVGSLPKAETIINVHVGSRLPELGGVLAWQD